MKKRMLACLLVLVSLSLTGCICVSSTKAYKEEDKKVCEKDDYEVKTYFYKCESGNNDLFHLIQTVIIENWNHPTSGHRIYQMQQGSDVVVRTSLENHKKIKELIDQLNK